MLSVTRGRQAGGWSLTSSAWEKVLALCEVSNCLGVCVGGRCFVVGLQSQVPVGTETARRSKLQSSYGEAASVLHQKLALLSRTIRSH